MSEFEDYPVDERVEKPEMSEIESIGAQRVRLDFNPSKDDLVDRIKRKTAELIDLCDAGKVASGAVVFRDQGEINRLWALAQTYYEIAEMLAVKAATAKR